MIKQLMQRPDTDFRPSDQDINQILEFPEHHVTVTVPVDSPAYQKYLEANAAREKSRELTGYVTTKAQGEYIKAVQGVIAFGMQLKAGDRAKPY